MIDRHIADLAAVTCQFLLVATFALAGTRKLRSGSGPSLVLMAAGLPGFLADLLGPVEIALAVLLATLGTAETFLAAGALLAGMSLVLLVARQRGYEGGCYCFGEERRARPHLEIARAVLLITAAVVAAMTTSGRALWASAPTELLEASLLTAGSLVAYTLASGVWSSLSDGSTQEERA